MKIEIQKIITWPIVILVLLLAINTFAVDDNSVTHEVGVSEPYSYLEMVDRPERSEIKKNTIEVMRRPEFHEIMKLENSIWSIWRKFIGFLSRIFDSIDGPEASGIVKFFVWVLIIWCVITLLAILGHFIWTLYIMLAKGSVRSKPFSIDANFAESVCRMDIEDIIVEMEKCLKAKDYARALSFLTASLLKHLEAFGFVVVHPSKTNGDYLKECGRGRSCFTLFRKYIVGFESVAYGFKRCDELYFQEMYKAYEQIERECEKVN